jgi:hypothetical protein
LPRIRTIKPEFCQSESLGRCSRNARLLFILLWTHADDEGRCRGSPRWLANTLFPFDDDAITSIETWLAELTAENCIRPYSIDGNHYIDIPKWLAHQKIDKPSKSRLPPYTNGQFAEPSTKPRRGLPEYSSGDLGPRTK